MKIIFFGSDDFAVTHLERLLESRHEVLACVTQVDRPKGRHLQLHVTAVKECALKKKLEVLDPHKLSEKSFIERLKSYDADLFVIVAYGQILPEDILSIPRNFCVNVHASLLPEYRGAAPINWAILNGEKETGVTVFKLAKTVDSGEIISQKIVPILKDDTSISLREKMSLAGAELLIKTLDLIEKGSYTLTKQDSKTVTYAPKLKKDQGLIPWNDSAVHIQNLVRGLLPWPSAFCYFGGKRLKILETEIVEFDIPLAKPGDVMKILPQGFIVKTATAGLLIRKVHPESSKAMDAKSFLVGHKLKIGDNFSNK